jgi:predicted phosphodiesterase
MTSGDISRRRILGLVVAAAILAGTNCSTTASRPWAQEEGITKGPVLLRVYQTRAAVMWETESKEPCKLHYGKGSDIDRYVESSGEKVQYDLSSKDEGEIEKTVYIHKVWIEGLDAGTTYNYRVSGPEVKGKTYQFKTVPSAISTVRFVVYGDSRTRPEVHRKLVELMKAKKVDFIVNSGDFVTDGGKYEQWGPQFFEPIKGLAEGVPIYAIKGNHEGTSGNYEKLLIPPGETNDFGFDYGPVHYFCADNTAKKIEPSKILDAITSDAKNSEAQWKFVSFHRPSLNFGHHWSAWGYPDALPRLSEAGADFVVVGHSHLYERFRPIAPAAEGTGGHVTYITSGGGGALLSSVNPTAYHAFAKSTLNFCLFEIEGDKLNMDVIDVNGKVIDRLEIRKSGGQLNEEYTQTAIPMEEIRQFQEANLQRQK